MFRRLEKLTSGVEPERRSDKHVARLVQKVVVIGHNGPRSCAMAEFAPELLSTTASGPTEALSISGACA